MRLPALSIVLLTLAACDTHEHEHIHDHTTRLAAEAHDHDHVAPGEAVDAARAEALERYHAGDHAGFAARMETVAAASNDDVDHYNLACGYALTGQRDKALDQIALLVDRGSTWDFAGDSDFDTLKTDARFHELLARAATLELADEKLESTREMAMDRYHAGNYSDFVLIMEKVAKYSPDDVDRYNLACGYALTGDKDEAIALLEDLTDRGVDHGAATDSDFASLQDDPRFHAVLAKLHAM